MKQTHDVLTALKVVVSVLAAAAALSGCGGSKTDGPKGTGGATQGTGGAAVIGGNGGATQGTGGVTAISGGGSTGTAVGGGTAVATGGGSGAGSGGAVAAGASGSMGGSAAGGRGTGGAATGGSAGPGSGGTATGGAETGSGGAGVGGTTKPGSGGAGAGGTTKPGSGGAGTGGATNPGSGGAGKGGASGAGGATGSCTPACDYNLPSCCGNTCVYLLNDPENCGACGVRCPSGSYCNETCVPITCSLDGGTCAGGGTCCGATCCTAEQNCCATNSPVGPMRPVCFNPTAVYPRCPPNVQVASDRNLKKNVVFADPEAVLAGVRQLPISNWSYLDEPATVRHLGPMAQDFHAVFGLGDDNRSYSPVDGHGVALAAIQALDRLVRAQQAQIENLERANQVLSRRLRAMEQRALTADLAAQP